MSFGEICHKLASADEVKIEILEALKRCSSVKGACYDVGIASNIFYEWKKTDMVFALEVANLEKQGFPWKNARSGPQVLKTVEVIQEAPVPLDMPLSLVAQIKNEIKACEKKLDALRNVLSILE